MHDEPEIDNAYWNEQLRDIDVSPLLGVQTEQSTAQVEHTLDMDEYPEEFNGIIPLPLDNNEQALRNQRNTLLVMATLAGALRDIKAAPESMHSAMVVCRLANGTYRLIFPHMYKTVTLKNLSQAVAYFSDLLEEREDGEGDEGEHDDGDNPR